jgi:hypothetical protein
MEAQLEEELLLLIFKFGLNKVETVLTAMKPTIRERFEERLKIIFTSTDVQDQIIISPVPEVQVPEVKVPEPEVQVPEVQVPEPVPEPTEPIPKGTNEKKKAQREAEKKKREENEAQGIFAQDLLTEDNLRTWRAANHSNAYIAREFVGCREEEVAKAMKKFSIFKPLNII